MTDLKGSQKKYLKSLGHHLKPIVNIGKANITQGILDKISRELELHELIKIKLNESAEVSIKEAAEDIAKNTECVIIRIIGFTALLYKRNEKEPIIELPK